MWLHTSSHLISCLSVIAVTLRAIFLIFFFNTFYANERFARDNSRNWCPPCSFYEQLNHHFLDINSIKFFSLPIFLIIFVNYITFFKKEHKLFLTEIYKIINYNKNILGVPCEVFLINLITHQVPFIKIFQPNISLHPTIYDPLISTLKRSPISNLSLWSSI